jgi:hypothetical protein
MGFHAWKPYVILKALAAQPDGSVVVYRDVNVTKYPEYLIGLARLRETCEHVLRRCGADWWVPWEEASGALTVRKYCKAHAIDTMVRELGQARSADAFRDYPLLNASLLVVRKTPASIDALRLWMRFCQRRELLSPLPDPRPDPQFKWHTPEQGLLCIVARYLIMSKRLPRNWPVLSFGPCKSDACDCMSRAFVLSSLVVHNSAREQGQARAAFSCGGAPTATLGFVKIWVIALAVLAALSTAQR